MIRRPIVKAAICTAVGFLSASCGWLPPWERSVATPGVEAPLPKQGRAAFYVVVERGQTLDQIMKIYRVAREDIVVANHLRFPYQLKPGLLLEVPLGRHTVARDNKRWAAKTALPKTAAERTPVRGETLEADPVRLSEFSLSENQPQKLLPIVDIENISKQLEAIWRTATDGFRDRLRSLIQG